MINPSHLSIGRIFESRFVFEIPKYQRSYAWEDAQVIDFIDDIKKCYAALKNGTSIEHFFGGLVCVQKGIPGSARQQFQVVDGQQRLATFILLVVNIVRIYEQISRLPEVSGAPALNRLVGARINRLNDTYLTYQDEINREPVTIDRLQMSKADHAFFKGLIQNTGITPSRNSHEKMNKAFSRIGRALKVIVDSLSTVSEKIDVLKDFEDIIHKNCTVIFIWSDTPAEAYRLFQVLNDRGISLTDGDLLRSRTLELLDNQLYQVQQNNVENAWDAILKTTSKTTEEFLRYYYASNKGKRPGSATLFDDFLDQFFPIHKSTVNTIDEATQINTTMDIIKGEYDQYIQINEGEWPYSISQPITRWDIERLRLLVVELDHSLCIPLLLAACQLDHRKFAEIIQLIELFIFRYKYICNNHVGSLGEIYLEESVAIRQLGTNYNINSLRNKLRNLQDTEAQDDKFKLLLNELSYKPRGGNKIIKYFFITLEYYLAWYNTGANGRPKCTDKSRIFDFANTTIEHIYSQNEDTTRVIPTMESKKNLIGNLTVLDPNINNTLGNIPYSQKRIEFEKSAVLMNRDIAASYATWDLNSFEDRTNKIVTAACRIFKV